MRDRGGTRLLAAIGLVALGSSACRASVKGSANVNASEVQVDEDRKWEVAEPASPAAEAPPASAPQAPPRVASAVTTAPPAAAPAGPAGVHFLGVTHDLSLSSGAPRAAVCRCLAVAYGAPNDAKFTWQAGAPPNDSDAIAIAISTDGVACSQGLPPARLSIAAIEREGTDIVLVVENLREGRPIMRGALAVWPGPNGAIVVRTRGDKAYPAASGPEPCRVALK